MPESNHPRGARSHTPFAGCVIMLAVLAVMVFLVGFSTWGLFRQFNEIVKFTAEQPLPVAVCGLDGREAEVNAVAEKLEKFRQELAWDGDAKLLLTVTEMNLIIAAYDPFKDLRGTMRVLAAEGDSLTIGIAFKLNGKPRLAHKGEGGWLSSDPRYLNATMQAKPRLMGREVVLTVESITVPGTKVPLGFIEQFSPYHISRRRDWGDARLGPAMGRLTSVQVADGCLALERKPGEHADDRMGAAQVKSAGTRLLKWLGVAAAVFLAVVGVLLVAGWRAKARRGG
jgi:hypothetical protein